MSIRRVAVLYGGLLLAFAVVACRLYLMAGNTAYASRAAGQSEVTLELPAWRGNFYDCDGLPLTGLQEEYYALCLPGEGSYARLYDVASEEGQALLYRKRNSAAPFLLRLSQDVSSLGVYTVLSPRRYCTIPLCVHLLGYLDGEGNGVAGLEAALESVLADGKAARLQCTVTGQGRLVDGTEPVYTQPETSGLGVKLTISRAIQRGVEAVAAETMSTGCILVLDTATAQVRASVSLPGYDPENVSDSLSDPDSPLLDRTLCAYAVGSVFKPVLAAAALEEGQTGLAIDCPGYTLLDGQVYRCASGVAHGETDLAGALEKSCNGYFIRLGQSLGAEKVREMAARLGFGQAVYLAGGLHAAAGVLPETEQLSSSGALANFSFGQGELLATPVQIAGVMNAIASDGIYRTPTFLLGTVDEKTGVLVDKPARSAAVQRAFSEDTAETLRALLCGVVDEGTGREAAPVYETAGGKTGTAQTGQFTEEGEEKMNLWFAGFYPAEHPAYTVVVLQDGQTDPAFSSAKIFSKVCEVLYLLEE